MALLAGASASCRAGCGGGGGGRALDGALALIPADARMILFVDFDRMRDAPTWKKLTELTRQNPDDKKRIDEFTLRTGFDPLRQVRSLVIAFPEDAKPLGELGVVVRGEGFDEKRLVAYASDQVKKQGYDLTATARGKRTLWTETREAATSGFFPDYQTFVLGAGGWAEKMVDLADGTAGVPSAETNADLVSLCTRAAQGGPLWAAAVVPAETRRKLLAAPELDSAASVSRLTAAVDFGAGLGVELRAYLSNARDARTMAAKVNESLREAKRNTRVLMLGLGPYLDGLAAHADGPSLSVALALSEGQVSDLLGRLSGFLQHARPAGLGVVPFSR